LKEAESLVQANPRLSLGAALQITQGLYSLQDWVDGRRKKLEARGARRLPENASPSDLARQWLAQLSGQCLTLCRLGYSTAYGELEEERVYELHIRRKNGDVKVCKKLQVGCVLRLVDRDFWRPAMSLNLELQQARLRVPEQPVKRRVFPQKDFEQHRGQRVEVLLLHGVGWSGYLQWEDDYSFLLTTEPGSGAEMLIYKTAVWSIAPAKPLTSAVDSGLSDFVAGTL